LPAHIQELAKECYGKWRENPWHPSLNFEELGNARWSVRVGAHHRALGKRSGDKILWFWIGSHEAYNKLISR